MISGEKYDSPKSEANFGQCKIPPSRHISIEIGATKIEGREMEVAVGINGIQYIGEKIILEAVHKDILKKIAEWNHYIEKNKD